jgi:hypothetical protein
MEKLFVFGILVLVLAILTLLLSAAAAIYSCSISLRNIWKRNLYANCRKISKQKFAEYKMMLKTLRPIQLELGRCYYLDQQAVIPFYETALDKTILMSEVFPKAIHVN